MSTQDPALGSIEHSLNIVGIREQAFTQGWKPNFKTTLRGKKKNMLFLKFPVALLLILVLLFCIELETDQNPNSKVFYFLPYSRHSLIKFGPNWKDNRSCYGKFKQNMCFIKVRSQAKKYQRRFWVKSHKITKIVEPNQTLRCQKLWQVWRHNKNISWTGLHGLISNREFCAFSFGLNDQLHWGLEAPPPKMKGLYRCRNMM